MEIEAMVKKKYEFDLGLLSTYRTHLFAVAIIMVVFHHLTYKSMNGLVAQGYMFLRVTGAAGVDVFLFLAGFGCYYSFAEDENIWGFYKRRLIRILPAYFVVAIPAYFVTDILVDKAGVIKYLLNVSLLSFWIRGGGDWYIAASLFLYFIFPFIYMIIKKCRFGYLVLILMAGSIICILNYFNQDYLEATSRLWARIPVFLMGTFIAPLIKRHCIIHKWKVKRYCVILLNLCTLFVEAVFAWKGAEYAYSFWARLIYCPLAISLVIILTDIFDRVRFNNMDRLLLFLGSITLEIYMLNQRMIDGCTYIFSKISDKKIFILIGNVVGIMVTIFSSYLLHNTISGLLKKYNMLNNKYIKR